jgi:hypothetical protein
MVSKSVTKNIVVLRIPSYRFREVDKFWNEKINSDSKSASLMARGVFNNEWTFH